DGGGVRGLSELVILQELMSRVNKKRRRHDQLEPWQLFDMIGGSSTGGLMAIMLGSLHMSVQECIEAYLDYAKTIFAPKRSKW
ncbi:acyl transferase/acyl hydrolase/lysophospholipase, partial [Pyrenochaeta sp. MPI-SDFR-AT-0127]